jgi:hypothetical protein
MPFPGLPAASPAYSPLVASSSERGAVERYRLTGAEWETLEAVAWEFLVEHAAGNDGSHRPA